MAKRDYEFPTEDEAAAFIEGVHAVNDSSFRVLEYHQNTSWTVVVEDDDLDLDDDA